MEIIEKAIQLVEDGHLDEALAILRTHLATCSDDEKAIIAQLYMEWGFFDEASDILEELLDKYPDNNELKVMLSSIYIDLERDEDALELLNAIDKDDPVYSESLLQEADLYESQGLYEVAELKLREAKELNEDNVIIDFALGELLFSSGQFSRAITHYEKVLLEEEEIASININERIAECLAASGEFEHALLHYEKIESRHADILFKHGLTAYYAKRLPIAINVWTKLAELDPYYHTVYVHLANALYEELRFEEAYDIVQKGIEYDEFNKELYLIAAKIGSKLGHFEKSDHYVRHAIELDADYKEAIMFLIDSLKENDEHEEIIALIKGINESHAHDPDYDWELARAHYEREDYDEALALYKDAYNYLKANPTFLKEYGYFLTEEGLTEEAVNILKEYVTFIQDDEDVLQFLERLTTDYS